MSIVAVQTEKGIKCGCNNCNGQMNGICNCAPSQQTLGGLSQAGSGQAGGGWLTAIQGAHAVHTQNIPAVKIQQGWECPRCKEINAPFVNKCGCK